MEENVDGHMIDVPEGVGKLDTRKGMKLSDKDLLELNFRVRKLNLFKKVFETIELKKELIKARKDILDRDDIILDLRKIQEDFEYSSFKDSCNKELRDLSTKYGIEEDVKWNYNAETGEIIIP